MDGSASIVLEQAPQVATSANGESIVISLLHDANRSYALHMASTLHGLLVDIHYKKSARIFGSRCTLLLHELITVGRVRWDSWLVASKGLAVCFGAVSVILAFGYGFIFD